jgi:RHS repeat-associated protein
MSTNSTAIIGKKGSSPTDGAFHLRARYYDPATAQFTSRDPAVAQTRSAYGYVGDNPLNATDPAGLFSVAACVGPSIALVFQFQFDLCGQVAVDTSSGRVRAGLTETYTMVAASGLPQALGTPAASANAFWDDLQCPRFV